jgi:four helix bundle protein
MSLQNFRSYTIAVEFYELASLSKIRGHLRDQLLRASSSIVLNLAEGSAKASQADRKRFYRIAFGSQRECVAIVTIGRLPALAPLCDRLGGHLFRLVNSPRA